MSYNVFILWGADLRRAKIEQTASLFCAPAVLYPKSTAVRQAAPGARPPSAVE